jgi:hypothetical protein
VSKTLISVSGKLFPLFILTLIVQGVDLVLGTLPDVYTDFAISDLEVDFLSTFKNTPHE